MKNKTIPYIIFAFLLLPFFALADMGFHPEATFTVTIDGRPFNDALISVQECNADKRYSSSDYSLSGLGINAASFNDNFLTNVLEPDENGNYLSKEDIKAFSKGYQSYAGATDISWNDEQLQLARNFVLDAFDEGKQCFWQPGERVFTNCENTTCHVTYAVPDLFRIKVLDFETGKTYTTQDIGRAGLNTKFSLNFNSSDGRETVEKLTAKISEQNAAFAVIIFFFVFLINMILELLSAIALAYFPFKIKVRKIILPVLLGNIISHPVVYFVPQLFNFKSAMMIVLGMDFIMLGLEAFAVLLEAFLIARMAKVKWQQAVLISFIVNLLSFFVGAFIMF